LDDKISDRSDRAREIFEYISPKYKITLQERKHDKDHVHILLKNCNSRLQFFKKFYKNLNGFFFCIRIRGEARNGYLQRHGGIVMKKALVTLLIAVTVLSIETANVFGAGPGTRRVFINMCGGGICNPLGIHCSYVDANNDGICDACGEYHCPAINNGGQSFIDANGDGICDNYGSCHRNGMAGIGYGRYFFDADGDGICDNYPVGNGIGGCGKGFCGCRSR